MILEGYRLNSMNEGITKKVGGRLNEGVTPKSVMYDLIDAMNDQMSSDGTTKHAQEDQDVDPYKQYTFKVYGKLYKGLVGIAELWVDTGFENIDDDDYEEYCTAFIKAMDSLAKEYPSRKKKVLEIKKLAQNQLKSFQEDN